MLHRLRRLFLSPRPAQLTAGEQLGDDYDWSAYHLEYRAQLAELEAHTTLRLFPGDARLVNGQLALRDGLFPLHPNHQCLYETIAALDPASAIEVGCGGGDHLHNLKVLFPDLTLTGLDRSAGQLAFLAERSPEVGPFARQFDITMPPRSDAPLADLVYTQAVVMHIRAGNGHYVALANIFRMARRCVLLMENWKRHAFMDDIRLLQHEKMIDWQELHFHAVPYRGTPRLMAIAPAPLPLPTLGDYEELIEGMNS